MLVAVVVGVLLVVQTLNRRWTDDYWLHQATLDAFRRNLWHPIQPMVGTHDKFEYYSPYMFVLAVIARVSGASSVVVLQCAAVCNLMLFFVAFRLFVSQLTNRVAVTCALIATLVLWGIRPWRWSGFLNLYSIGFGLPYPSMFATGVALLVGWAFSRYGATRNRWWLALVGSGLAIVLLSHTFTGIWTVVMLLALAVHRRLLQRDQVLPLALTLAGIVAALWLWPYYPFFRLFSGGGNHAEDFALYRRAPQCLFLAIPGAVVLWRRFKRDRTDPLVLMFIGALALYAAGAVIGGHNFGRMLPLVALPLHVGDGELIASTLTREKRASPRVLALLGLWGVMGLVGVSIAFASFIPHRLLPASLRAKSSWAGVTSRYSALDHALPAGTVVVTQVSVMEEVVPAHGLRDLYTTASVFVPDADRRRRASAAILLPTTTAAERARLIREYHVGGVLCADRSCVARFNGTEVSVDEWTLVRLPGAVRASGSGGPRARPGT